MAAKNSLQGIDGKIDRLGADDPIVAVEPDIDLFLGEAADQVRRRGGEAEEFPRLLLAGVGADRASWLRSAAMAEVYQSCLRSSEKAKTSSLRGTPARP